MARDIGGYFEQLTKKARGGRRLDTGGERPADARPGGGEPAPAPPAGRPSNGGGLGDMLKDILGKSRTTATTTAKKASETARRRLDRRKPPTPVSTRTVGGRKRTSALPPEGVVTIEYSPRIDGDPDPGEVVWTWVPFEEDPGQGKDRPVVVIGRRGRTLVGVPLTTKRDEREAQIAIGTGDWDPKRRPSYARIWRMLDVDAETTRREGAVLERKRFDDVVTAVDLYYDVRRPGRDGADDDD
jgi:hypothetical protein